MALGRGRDVRIKERSFFEWKGFKYVYFVVELFFDRLALKEKV